MRYLLDTHIIIWLLSSSLEQIRKLALKQIENPKNQLFISSVSLWEIELKLGKGSLEIKGNYRKSIVNYVFDGYFSMLNLNYEHVFRLKELQNIHKDPFDRMIVSQCISEKMVLITKNKILKKYGIQTLW